MSSPDSLKIVVGDALLSVPQGGSLHGAKANAAEGLQLESGNNDSGRDRDAIVTLQKAKFGHSPADPKQSTSATRKTRPRKVEYTK